MFQPQFGAIASALKAAGLPGDSATAIARILANPQNTGRGSPAQVDTTPRNMRLVDRQAKKTLPSLDFREGDPDHRAPRIPQSEEKPEPEQPGTVQIAYAPQQVNNINFNVAPGGFANAVPRGNAVEVGMRIKGPDRSITTIDATSSSLVGKRIRAETDAAGLRFFIEDTGQELIWKLQSVGTPAEDPDGPPPPPPESPCDALIEVVTDVRLEASGLVVEKRTLSVCDVNDTGATTTIPTDDCPTP